MENKIDFKPIHEIKTYDQVIISTNRSSVIIDLRAGLDVEIKQNAHELYISWLTLYVGYSFIVINIDNILAVNPINNQLYIEVNSISLKGYSTMNRYMRYYTIKEQITGKVKKVSSKKFSYDTVKKYYPDILSGEYTGEFSNKFYSPKFGYIFSSWE